MLHPPIRDGLLSIAIFLCCSTNALAAFSFVANHPYAIKQPTYLGRTIQQLQAYEGVIYAGYGDWYHNTGPVRICKLIPASKRFVCEFTQTTEMISRFRVLNGKLYSISIDPMPPNQYGHAYAVQSLGLWTGVPAYKLGGLIKYPFHPYDINIFNGDLWTFSDRIDVNNKKVQNPTAWRSRNTGITWAALLELPLLPPPSALCFGEIYKSKLYVQAASLFCKPVESFSRVYDGTKWTTGPSLIPTSQATRKTGIFTNRMVMIHNDKLYSFDGTKVVRKFNSGIFDYTIDGSTLYVLRQDGKTCRTSNLKSLECFDIAPKTARSIEVLNNVMYVGTTLGNIFSAPIPQPKSDHQFDFIPTIYLLLQNEDV